MKRYALTFILFLIFSIGYSQNIDSLLYKLRIASESSEKLQTCFEIVDYYSDYDNDLSEKYSDSLLILANSFKSDYYYAIACRHKGLANYKRGNYDVALNYYEKTYNIAKSINNQKILYQAYNDLGMIYCESDRSDVAVKYYQKAIDIAKNMDDKDALAITFVNMGNALYVEEDYDKVANYYDSALNLTTDVDVKLAITSNLAYLYNIMGRFDESKQMYEKVLDMIEDGTNNYLYALALNNISRIYIIEGQYDKAAKAIAIVDSVSEMNSFDVIRQYMYENYHDLYVRLGDFEKADYYRDMYDIIQDSIYSSDLNAQLNELQNRYAKEKAELEMQRRDEQIQHQHFVNMILAIAVVLTLLFVVVVLWLFLQKNKLSKLLLKTNEVLTRRDKEISDNLEYAREIQLGCMSNVPDNQNMFVLDLPKVTVGGDFHLVVDKGSAKYIVVGDCTGHGISGGFLSVLGIKSVHSAIEKYDSLTEIASEINNDFNQIVSSADNLKGESLCLSIVRICGNELNFLGSKHKMWIVSNGNIVEHKTVNEILGSQTDLVFNEMSIPLNAGDVVFLSSDGYPDQFGCNGKGKLKYSRFREILQECAAMSPENAKKYLADKLESWKGSEEQTDDILVIGLYC